MQRSIRSLGLLVILGGGLLATASDPAAAQVPVVTTFSVPAPTVSFVPVRRGLLGLRRDFVPVVSQPAPVVVARPVVVSSPVVVSRPVVSVARPVIVSSPVTVARPVVVARPVPVATSPVVVSRRVITNSPVVVSRPVIVNRPVTTMVAPAPMTTVFMPAW